MPAATRPARRGSSQQRTSSGSIGPSSTAAVCNSECSHDRRRQHRTRAAPPKLVSSQNLGHLVQTLAISSKPWPFSQNLGHLGWRRCRFCPKTRSQQLRNDTGGGQAGWFDFVSCCLESTATALLDFQSAPAMTGYFPGLQQVVIRDFMNADPLLPHFGSLSASGKPGFSVVSVNCSQPAGPGAISLSRS